MNRAFVVVVALLVVLGAGLAASVPSAGAELGLYGNYTPSDNPVQNITDDRQDATISNVTFYLSMIGTFVVGDDPSNPGVGPIFTGLIVGAFAMSMLGTSRAGFAASGAMAMVVIAALSTSTGAGLLPRWMYGTAVLIVGFLAGVQYIRMTR